MQVLVTGATGLIGRHLLDVLGAEGVALRAFARPSSDTTPLLQAWPNLEIVRGAVDDGQSIRRAVQGVQVIFHLAGYLNVHSPFSANGATSLYYRINVDLTERFLEEAAAAGLRHFVFASSASVYHAQAPTPTPEDAPLAPHSAYGKSKAAAEARVQAWGRRGMVTTIVRPSLIYGPGDRHFTPLALRLARLPLLPLVDGGLTLLDMVYARDVATLMWRAVQAGERGRGVYNAGPGTPTTLAGLVEAYSCVTGRGPHIVDVSPQTVHRLGRLARPLAARLAPGLEATLSPRGIELMVQDLHLDMRRAHEELGFRPRYSLEEGLRETLREMPLCKPA